MSVNSILLQNPVNIATMETIGTRVRREREAQGIARGDLSKRTGVGYSTIAELERGGMQTTTKLRVIADALGVSLRWLETGKGSKAEDSPVSAVVAAPETTGPYLRVDQLDAEGSMGDGRENQDYPEVIRSVEYTETFIRSLVGFIPPPGRLKLLTGRGDSMAPLIQPGDVVVVDTGIMSFDGDGIYLINMGNGQQIKRLIDRGMIHVASENKSYGDPFPVPEGTLIGGKVYLRNRIERFS